jgi:hypothetical protein
MISFHEINKLEDKLEKWFDFQFLFANIKKSLNILEMSSLKNENFVKNRKFSNRKSD